MSLPPGPRGSLPHTGVQPTQTGKNAGKENPRHKRPAQNKSKPAYLSLHRLTTRTCLRRGNTGANRKRMIFFVNTSDIEKPTVVTRVEFDLSKEITTPLFR